MRCSSRRETVGLNNRSLTYSASDQRRRWGKADRVCERRGPQHHRTVSSRPDCRHARKRRQRGGTLGGEVIEAGPGELVVKPRGVPPFNAHDEPAMGEIVDRYRLDLTMETIPGSARAKPACILPSSRVTTLSACLSPHRHGATLRNDDLRRRSSRSAHLRPARPARRSGDDLPLRGRSRRRPGWVAGAHAGGAARGGDTRRGGQVREHQRGRPVAEPGLTRGPIRLRRPAEPGSTPRLARAPCGS